MTEYELSTVEQYKAMEKLAKELANKELEYCVFSFIELSSFMDSFLLFSILEFTTDFICFWGTSEFISFELLTAIPLDLPVL